MLIIFGTKRMKAQNLGPVSDTICGNCNNPVAYRLYHQRRWFHIFWIPLIPISNKHYVLCPICNKGGQVSGAQLPNVKALVEARRQFDAGQITRQDFEAQEAHYLALLNQTPYAAAGPPQATPPPPTPGQRPPGFDAPPPTSPAFDAPPPTSAGYAAPSPTSPGFAAPPPTPSPGTEPSFQPWTGPPPGTPPPPG